MLHRCIMSTVLKYIQLLFCGIHRNAFTFGQKYYHNYKVHVLYIQQSSLYRKGFLVLNCFTLTNAASRSTGTVMAVESSDKYAPGKKNRFVGICIQRGGHGLRAGFTLRNVIDGQGL